MTTVADELATRRAAREDDGIETGADDPGNIAPDAEPAASAEPAEAEAAQEEDKGPRLLQVALPGDWESISSEFGGLEPETSEIRLLGGKMPIEGSFAKGAELDLLVRVRVTGVLGQDVLDDWGKTTRTVRRHMARMVSVRRATR